MYKFYLDDIVLPCLVEIFSLLKKVLYFPALTGHRIKIRSKKLIYLPLQPLLPPVLWECQVP